jgi:hypothetical protein
MRVPRVRFTVRGMLVAAAIVALLLGSAIRLRQRREAFLRLASNYTIEFCLHKHCEL